ncbi:MAG TPA: ATP-binding protein [Coriobacteriia bacterium]|nr:ATP-binding protein [Coriobacteriia bacterium]
MERFLARRLLAWKTGLRRKPLILRGQRQVGKTWLLKQFGSDHYENVAYFNFEEDPALGGIFESTKNVDRILQHLSVVGGAPIKPGATLLVFDEIQESNAALNSLKYFAENAPEYHVTCAGSHLGIALSKPGSFPVGKVDHLTLHPMTFSEFLVASGDATLREHLDNLTRFDPVPDAVGQPLTEKLARYLVLGGMPEPVHVWVTERDMGAVIEVQQAILDGYQLDSATHAPAEDIARIGHVWKSLPAQLARENRKFVYGVAREGARARQYEDALKWLVETGIVTKVMHCPTPRLPLSAYDDVRAFKLYSADTGLLARQSRLDPAALSDPLAPLTEFKGALTENYVLQSLVAHFDVPPRYWTSGGKAEVEFLLQHGNDVHPVEVKSGRSVKAKGLSVYRNTYHPRVAVRLSQRNLQYRDGLLNVPLYMTDQLGQLLALAREA